MYQGARIKGLQVMLDVSGGLLAANTEPLHQLGGDQTPFPVGDKFDAFEAQEDFVFEVCHPLGLSGDKPSILPGQPLCVNYCTVKKLVTR